jgi:uncharacterized membrane protein
MVGKIKDISIKLADVITSFIGSWTFIVVQSCILTIWVTVNVLDLTHFDPYPFILMNLFLSFQAAYATPLILMSSNRQAERDRLHMIHEHEISEEDHIIIKDLKRILNDLQEDMNLSKQSLENHKRLEAEHEELKTGINEIKELLIKKKNRI